jgi:hypothetical protein
VRREVDNAPANFLRKSADYARKARQDENLTTEDADLRRKDENMSADYTD